MTFDLTPKELKARARVNEMDKGGGAADAALAMIRFARTIGKKRRAAA